MSYLSYLTYVLLAFNPIFAPRIRPVSGSVSLFFLFFLRFSVSRSSVAESSRRIIAPRVSHPPEEAANFSPPSIARRVVDRLVGNKRYRHR